MQSLNKAQIFLGLCLAFIGGVLLGPLLSTLITGLLAVIFVMCVSIGWSSKLSKFIGIAGLVLLAGSLRFQQTMIGNNLAGYYDMKPEIIGTISAEPDVRADKINLTLDDLRINGQAVDDRILVSVYVSRNFFYGDRVAVTGKVLEPKIFEDFNYKNYLSRFGVDAVMYYPEITTLSQNHGNRIKALLLTIKTNFLRQLSQILPEPQNAFLGGLLVGNKRSIPQTLIDNFNRTGTSHIIAISGFNITIIMWAIDSLLSRFGRRVSFLVNFLVIGCFVVLTGGSASVIRAAVMGIMVLVAKNLGRQFRPTNALVATAVVMIALNPKILLFDVGFQLSFLALAGLIFLSPSLTRALVAVPKIIREALVATIAAQIFAFPILLFNFGQLSLVAPLANVLVLPVIPWTMLFGFLAGSLGFVATTLAAICSWPAWWLLSYILTVINWCAHLPYASIQWHLSLALMLSYYLILFGGIVFIQFGFTKKLILATLRRQD